MAITVNLRYKGPGARAFAEEMTSSGTVALIRAEPVSPPLRICLCGGEILQFGGYCSGIGPQARPAFLQIADWRKSASP